MKDSYINLISMITLSLVWGSSFIFMKKGLIVYDFKELGALRLGIAFLFFFPFAIKALQKIDKKRLLPIIIVALVGNGAPAFLFALAQQSINSATAGMLNALVPIFSLIIGSVFIKNDISKQQWVGVAISFIGAISLSYASTTNFTFNEVLPIVLIILACVGYGLSVNIIKKYLHDTKPIHISSISFTIIGSFCLVYAIFFTPFISKTLSTPGAYTALGYIAILSILGTSLALLLFYTFIKRVSVALASSVTYLMPIVAILWGLLDGEIISCFQIVSISVILSGIYFIKQSNRNI